MDEVNTLFEAVRGAVTKEKHSCPPINMALKFELNESQIAPAVSDLKKLLQEECPDVTVTIDVRRNTRDLVVDLTPR